MGEITISEICHSGVHKRALSGCDRNVRRKDKK